MTYILLMGTLIKPYSLYLGTESRKALSRAHTSAKAADHAKFLQTPG